MQVLYYVAWLACMLGHGIGGMVVWYGMVWYGYGMGPFTFLVFFLVFLVFLVPSTL